MKLLTFFLACCERPASWFAWLCIQAKADRELRQQIAQLR